MDQSLGYFLFLEPWNHLFVFVEGDLFWSCYMTELVIFLSRFTSNGNAFLPVFICISQYLKIYGALWFIAKCGSLCCSLGSAYVFIKAGTRKVVARTHGFWISQWTVHCFGLQLCVSFVNMCVTASCQCWVEMCSISSSAEFSCSLWRTLTNVWDCAMIRACQKP